MEPYQVLIISDTYEDFPSTGIVFDLGRTRYITEDRITTVLSGISNPSIFTEGCEYDEIYIRKGVILQPHEINNLQAAVCRRKGKLVNENVEVSTICGCSSYDLFQKGCCCGYMR